MNAALEDYMFGSLVRPGGPGRGFSSRAAAGRALAFWLRADTDARSLVLAISRGGVAVAAPMAAALGTGLDVLLIRRTAIGLFVENRLPRIDLERVIALGLHAWDVSALIDQESAQLAREVRLFRGRRPFPNLYKRDVILVDDGLTSDSVVHAAVECARDFRASRVRVALPMCTRSLRDGIMKSADELVYVRQTEVRGGMYSYDDPAPVGDMQALALLDRARYAATRTRDRTAEPDDEA